MQTGKGSSGAKVTFTEHGGREVAHKFGNIRVADQGKYLLKIESMAVPKVYSVGETGYYMERLVEFSDPSPYDVYQKLRDHIWANRTVLRGLEVFQKELLEMRLLRGVTQVDAVIRETYDLGPLCADIAEFLAAIHGSYYFENGLDLYPTHGDPTLENVMYRRGQGEGIVLIDPIPPSPYAPSLREVDLGKIAQSLAGFEHDRYGLPGEFDSRELMPWLYFVCDREDVIPEVVIDWAIVHIIRALPYVNRSVRWVLLASTLQRLRKARMEVADARRIRP